MEIHYEVEEDVAADAPASGAELATMLIDGSVTLATNIWIDGMDGWLALEDTPAGYIDESDHLRTEVWLQQMNTEELAHQITLLDSFGLADVDGSGELDEAELKLLLASKGVVHAHRVRASTRTSLLLSSFKS